MPYSPSQAHARSPQHLALWPLIVSIPSCLPCWLDPTLSACSSSFWTCIQDLLENGLSLQAAGCPQIRTLFHSSGLHGMAKPTWDCTGMKRLPLPYDQSIRPMSRNMAFISFDSPTTVVCSRGGLLVAWSSGHVQGMGSMLGCWAWWSLFWIMSY